MSETGEEGAVRSVWTNADQNRLMRCREHILQALKDAMAERHKHLHWVEFERQAVAMAANEWAKAQGIDRTVTVADVEVIEQKAVGHVDYASKLALYVAEFVVPYIGRDQS